MEKLRKLCNIRRMVDKITFVLALLMIGAAGWALITIMTIDNPILPISIWWVIGITVFSVGLFILFLELYNKATDNIINFIKGYIIRNVGVVLEGKNLSCSLNVLVMSGDEKQVYAINISCLEKDKKEIFIELETLMPDIEVKLNEILFSILKEKIKICYIRNTIA